MSKAYEYTVKLNDMFSHVMDKISGGSQKLNTVIEKTDKSIKGLRERLGHLSAMRDSSFRTDHIAKYNNLIQQTQRELHKLENLPAASFGQRLQNIGQKFTNMTGLSIGFVSAAGAIGAVTSVAKLGLDMEQTQIAFETMLGSAEAGMAKINELKRFADVSPFNTNEVIAGGQALIGFGVDVDNLIPIMNRLGDVSGGNANKFKSLLDNYGKLVSAQKANTTDLNQFATQGVPIWAELQKMMGFENSQQGAAQLRDYIEKNGASVEMVNEALRRLTSEGGKYFGMMEKQSQSGIGKLSTLMAKFEDIGTNIGLFLIPAVSLFADTVMATIQFIEDFAAPLTVVAGILAAYAIHTNAAALATLFFNTVNSAATVVMGAMTVAQWLLNAAMWAFPAVWIVAAIGIVVMAVIYLYRKFDWLQKFVAFVSKVWKIYTDIWMQIFEKIGERISGIWDVIVKAFQKFVKFMAPVIDFFKDFFETVFGKKSALDVSANINKTETATNLSQGASPEMTKGIDETIKGGAKATTVNITVGKMMEKMAENMAFANVKEGAEDLEQAVLEALNRVIGSAVYAARQ